MAYRDEGADERARRRILEWIAQHGRGSQKQLAHSVPGKYGEPKTEQWLSDILRGKSDLSLRDLDAIAEAMQVPPGHLVRRADRNYEELTMAESRLLAYVRSWPETVRYAWMSWLEYLTRFQRDSTFIEKRAKHQRTRKARAFEAPEARKKVAGND